MLIGLIVSIVIGVFFFVRSFKLANKNNELIELIHALNIKIDSTSDPVKEDFLKFVSDSREWAFEYIEEVQNGLKKFVKDIEPEIKYFEEYGSPIAIQPNYYSMKKVVEAYRELTKLLPKDLDA